MFYASKKECDLVAELLANGSSDDIQLQVLTHKPFKPKRWFRRTAVPSHYWVSITHGISPFMDYYEGRGKTPEKAVRNAVRSLTNNDSEPGLL